MPTPTRDRLSRRAFVRRAVAAGGAAALAACVGREGMPDVPQGPADPAALPERQHAWNDTLASDDAGNVLPPRHHVLRFFDLRDDGPPTTAARETVGATLRALERSYRRGNDGLVFAIGYGRPYFDRFGAGPASVDLPAPTALAPFEDPAFDAHDAVIHLASDHGQVALAAEEALLGERGELNGVNFDADLGEVFEPTDRRTGFVGEGLPADHQDVRGVPDSNPVSEDAPLYMGFKSGFRENQATEDRVTIRDGPFAGGTTMHVSRIRLDLEQWYEQDTRFQRVAKMFCPAHAEAGTVEGVGENLGTSSELGECPAHAADHARTKGVVGHSQKAARARDDDAPVILRRDFDSTDGDAAGLHFVSLQRAIADFVETREAMNGADLARDGAVGARTNNGILQYMTVTRRGNYLVPQRSRRALPAPEGA